MWFTVHHFTLETHLLLHIKLIEPKRRSLKEIQELCYRDKKNWGWALFTIDCLTFSIFEPEYCCKLYTNKKQADFTLMFGHIVFERPYENQQHFNLLQFLHHCNLKSKYFQHFH